MSGSKLKLKADWNRNFHYLSILINKFACARQSPPSRASGAFNSGQKGYLGLSKYLPQVGQETRNPPPPPLKPSMDERKINSSFHPLRPSLLPYPRTPRDIFLWTRQSPDNFLLLFCYSPFL